MREKVGKSRNSAFFQWFVSPEGRKVGSLKRRVRSHLARWEMKNCTPLWREAHLQVKMYKTHQLRLRCGKSARRCGAKHISKSKCTKHTSSGPLLAVEMSKKCTPLWREAHFEVKMLKNTKVSDHFWKFRCRFASLHYITLHYTPLHYNYNYTTTLHYNTLHYTKWHYITLHCTPLHYITLHYATFHYTSLHYTTLHSTTLQLQRTTILIKGAISR